MKTLKLVFQSLLNNGAVMEGKNQPWFVALILFILSVIFATYPTFNQINGRVGSTFLSGNTYSMENALTTFSETLYDEAIQLVVKTNLVDGETRYQLENEGTLWQDHFLATYPGSNFRYFQYSVGDASRLRVFYQADQSDEVTSEFLTGLINLELGNDNISSFMMLARNAVYVYLYNPTALASGTVAGNGYLANFTGTYDAVPVNTNLGSFVAVDLLGGYVDPSTRNQNIDAFIERVFNNWKQFFDQSFAFSKSILLLAQTGLTFVVNIIMAFLMSVVIFIMTRGKQNPNRHFKFGETMKIGAWALLSPALLTIVAGALFPEFSATAFVLFVGLRLMWLSSKYLRPMDMAPATVTKK
jgi:hypothetical protein